MGVEDKPPISEGKSLRKKAVWKGKTAEDENFFD